LRPLFESLRLLHDTSVNHINATIEHIYELLSDSYITRKQRGIFELGGQSLNSLIGVATKKQLHALRATAMHSSNINAHALNAWQKHRSFFLHDQHVDILVRETNRYADQFISTAQEGTVSCAHRWKPTSASEMKLFLGMTMVMSVVHKPTLNMHWTKSHTHTHRFIDFAA